MGIPSSDAPPEDPTSPTSSNFKSTAQPWEQEYDREPYPGNFKDMSEAINLFSLVVCFVSVFPAAPIFLIAMNLVRIPSTIFVFSFAYIYIDEKVCA